MNEINNLFTLDWIHWLSLTLIIIVGLTALYKMLVEFGKVVKSLYCRLKGLDPNPKNKEQDLEIDKIKARQDAFEQSLEIIKEGMMVATWDRIIHFGLNYIDRGHISYAEKDIFLAQSKSYSKCGGNGHLVSFVPMVEALPYTEDLTADEVEAIESDTIAKHKRVAMAKASLSSYYGK